MQPIQYLISLIICALASFLSPSWAGEQSLSADTTTDSGKHQSCEPSERVTEWFGKYDQIRRDAEMTLGDKLQSLLLNAKKPEKRNAALASRMIKKYTMALSEMKKLRSIPETSELQEGYIQYFSTARKLFADYLDAQKKVPFTNQSLKPQKRTLEELDKKNKQLDDQLRKLCVISKHKHS